MKASFERFGFKLVVFEDGYFIKEKMKTCTARYKQRANEKQKKLKIIQKLQNKYAVLIYSDLI